MWNHHRICEEISLADNGLYYVVMEDTTKQHKAPHVHLRRKGEMIATINIKTGKYIGKIPGDISSYFWGWLRDHRDRLMQDWEDLQNGKPPKRRKYSFRP